MRRPREVTRGKDSGLAEREARGGAGREGAAAGEEGEGEKRGDFSLTEAECERKRERGEGEKGR